ncbi:MAG: DNA-processing protein DprA [Gammaproteobacteria bacterium]
MYRIYNREHYRAVNADFIWIQDGWHSLSGFVSAVDSYVEHLLWAHFKLSARRKKKLWMQLEGNTSVLMHSARVSGLQLPDAMRDQLAVWQRDRQAVRETLASDLAWLQETGCSILMPSDTGYPDSLAQLPDAPIPIYMRGNAALLNQNLLAVVGSRNPSTQGREIAFQLSRELSALGFAIVSGLAVGIDTAAHNGALDNGGSTLAIMAHGMDRVYPPENRLLAQQIASKGLVLTEYPWGSPIFRAQFPMRNRIIAGLSKAVIVIEAAEKSGALITAHVAAELGKEVMAVPGSIRTGQSAGCHLLIREGAALVENSMHILQCLNAANQFTLPIDLPDGAQKNTVSKAEPDLAPDLLRLYRLVGDSPMMLDQLMQQTHSSASQIAALLVELELSGLVVRENGGYVRL